MTNDEIANQWKLRLEHTKHQVILATIHRCDVGQRLGLRSADYRIAVVAEHDASTDYSQTLRTYLDLVMYGKTPSSS